MLFWRPSGSCQLGITFWPYARYYISCWRVMSTAEQWQSAGERDHLPLRWWFKNWSTHVAGLSPGTPQGSFMSDNGSSQGDGVEEAWVAVCRPLLKIYYVNWKKTKTKTKHRTGNAKRSLSCLLMDVVLAHLGHGFLQSFKFSSLCGSFPCKQL